MTSALRPTVHLFGVKALTNLASLIEPVPPFKGVSPPPSDAGETYEDGMSNGSTDGNLRSA